MSVRQEGRPVLLGAAICDGVRVGSIQVQSIRFIPVAEVCHGRIPV